MIDMVERLRERAESYREGGPSSEHTAAMLDEAAREIETLRALSQAGAGGVVDERALDEARKVYNASLLSDGGAFGATERIVKAYLSALAASPSAGEPDGEMTRAMMDAGQRYLNRVALKGHHELPAQFRWTEFWSDIMAAAPTPPAPVQTASVEAVRAALDCAQWLEVILAETGWKEPEGEQHVAASIDRARSLTAPTQGDGPTWGDTGPIPGHHFGDEFDREPAPSSPVSSPSPAGGVREAVDPRRAIHEIVEWVEMEVDLSLRPALRKRIDAAKALLERPALSSPETGEVVAAEPKSELGTCQRCGMEMSWSYDCPNRADPIDAISTRNCPDALAALNPAPGHGEGVEPVGYVRREDIEAITERDEVLIWGKKFPGSVALYAHPTGDKEGRS